MGAGTNTSTRTSMHTLGMNTSTRTTVAKPMMSPANTAASALMKSSSVIAPMIMIVMITEVM